MDMKYADIGEEEKEKEKKKNRIKKSYQPPPSSLSLLQIYNVVKTNNRPAVSSWFIKISSRCSLLLSFYLSYIIIRTVFDLIWWFLLLFRYDFRGGSSGGGSSSCQEYLTTAPWFGMCNQPLQCYINVVLFFTGNGVAANLTILDSWEIPASKRFPNNQLLSLSLSKIRWLSTHILSMSPFSSRALGRSRLFPSTRTGIPASWGLSSRWWSSLREASILSGSAASTMYLKTQRNVNR